MNILKLQLTNNVDLKTKPYLDFRFFKTNAAWCFPYKNTLFMYNPNAQFSYMAYVNMGLRLKSKRVIWPKVHWRAVVFA